MPEKLRSGQQFRRALTWRAARTDPAARALATGFFERGDAAIEIGLLVGDALISGNDVLAPAMSGDPMPRGRDRLHQVRIFSGENAGNIKHRRRIGRGKHIENSPRSNPGSVFGPRLALKVEHAGLKRIAHRTDARRAVISPPLQHHADGQGDVAAGRPVGGKLHGPLGDRIDGRQWVHAPFISNSRAALPPRMAIFC